MEANTPQSNADDFGTMRKPSESFGTVRNAAEPFGTVPHASESFLTMPQPSAESSRASAARSENHTLTVRESARMFEAAGVARTERSIVNWCQPNPQGIARLDAYFDPNERKWFITPQSVELAIAEEKAKAAQRSEPVSPPAEPVRNASEAPKETVSREATTDSGRVRELEQKVMDLKILNSGKDYFIDQLRKERDGFIEQVVSASRQVGQLEAQLRQLQAPAAEPRNDSTGHSEA